MADAKLYALPENYAGNSFATDNEGNERDIKFIMSTAPQDPSSEKEVRTITITMEDSFLMDGQDNSDKLFALPDSLHRFPIIDFSASELAEDELGAAASGVSPSPSAPSLSHADEASAPPLSPEDFSLDLKSKLHKYFPDKTFRNLQFNKTLSGCNIQFDQCFQEATRIDYNDEQAYVFSAEPLNEMETLIFQVSETTGSGDDSISFGVTSCDLKKFKKSDLPASHYDLIDISDYWVFKDNFIEDTIIGDILSFTLAPEGRIMFQKNDDAPILLMHVDGSLKLWMFLDVIGYVTALKSIGCFTASKFKKTAVLEKSKSIDDTNVCVVCLDQPKELACIPCGHLSMCSNCANQITCTTNRCPLCQGRINATQRIYN